MKQKGKLFHVYSPHFYAQREALWADIWIHTTVKPGRQIRKFAPTFSSMDDLEEDIASSTDMLETNPRIIQEEWQRRIAAELRSLITIRDIIKGTEAIFIDNADSKYPDVYTGKKRISKSEAERMLKEFLSVHGFETVRLRWQRSSARVITI